VTHEPLIGRLSPPKAEATSVDLSSPFCSYSLFGYIQLMRCRHFMHN